MVLYTRFVDGLEGKVDAYFWMNAMHNPNFILPPHLNKEKFSPFPKTGPEKWWPIKPARDLATYTWEKQIPPPTRIVWNKIVPDSTQLGPYNKVLRLVANFIAKRKGLQKTDGILHKVSLKHRRNKEARERLLVLKPDFLVSGGIFRQEEVAVVSEAKHLGIPVLGFINAWDNISTKTRIAHEYDAYMLWSDHMEKHLHTYYPYTITKKVYKIGPPQFDLLFEKEYLLDKSDFCNSLSLDPARPIILYAVASPNVVLDHYGAHTIAKAIIDGKLENAQLIVRLHPQFNFEDVTKEFEVYGNDVVVQYKQDTKNNASLRFQSSPEITQWVSTMNHSDVIINFFSTITIEGCLLDKPTITVAYDPSPGKIHLDRIEPLMKFEHLQEIIKSNGVVKVYSEQELIDATLQALIRPQDRKDGRKQLATAVCGFTDGKSADRMAQAVFDFSNNTQ